ncbi:EpsG family protein [Microbacterium sp. MAH-37]|uniref:EpsG family protein n=2 Tax=unclassified Microbacterium TaxID=2609290 RepID=UPI001E28DFA6|nr:EpsG family protein [Microbacterium sp. MAH-37]
MRQRARSHHETRTTRGWHFNLLDLIALAALVTLPALRADTVGTDTIVYHRLFDAVPAEASLQDALTIIPQESGFVVLIFVIKLFGGSFHTLLWISSALAVVPAYVAIKRRSLDTTLAIALYTLLGFYFATFNTIRQSIAISLIFLGATYLVRRKGWVPFLIFGAIATSFHTSAIIAVIAYLLATRWRVTTRNFIFASVMAIALTAAIWASPWLASLLYWVDPSYVYYVDERIAAGLGLYLIIAARAALLIYGFSLKPQGDAMKYAAWSAIGVMCIIVGTQSIIASRLGGYFLICLCLFIPNVMAERHVSKTIRYSLIGISAVYAAFYLENYGDLTPYVTAHAA